MDTHRVYGLAQWMHVTDALAALRRRPYQDAKHLASSLYHMDARLAEQNILEFVTMAQRTLFTTDVGTSFGRLHDDPSEHADATVPLTIP